MPLESAGLKMTPRTSGGMTGSMTMPQLTVAPGAIGTPATSPKWSMNANVIGTSVGSGRRVSLASNVARANGVHCPLGTAWYSYVSDQPWTTNVDALTFWTFMWKVVSSLEPALLT